MELKLVVIVDLWDSEASNKVTKVIISLTQDEIEAALKRIMLCRAVSAVNIGDYDSPEAFLWYEDDKDRETYTKAEDFNPRWSKRDTTSQGLQWTGVVKPSNVEWTSEVTLSPDDLEIALLILEMDDDNLKVELSKLLRKEKILKKGDAAGAFKVENPLNSLALSRLILDGDPEDLPIILIELEEMLEKSKGNPIYEYQRELLQMRLKGTK